MPPFPKWSLVVAVNNDSVLNKTLLASPAVNEQCQLILERGHSCAGKAYNSGIGKAESELLVFAHQDIYLPKKWMTDLNDALRQLESLDPHWGALGLVGVTGDAASNIVGYCYSTGLRQIVGQPFGAPVEAQSLDEIVLVIRRSSGIKFDEGLPGFHFYGTDLCQLAKQKNLKSYIVQAFCIHNTNGIKSFPPDFWRGYLYLRRKWREDLPIRTCCTQITKGCGPAIKRIVEDFAHQILWPKKVGGRWEDVDRLRQFVESERLNFETFGTSAQSRCPKPA